MAAPRYEATTEPGRAIAALADELLSDIQLPPGMLAAMWPLALPYVRQHIDGTVQRIDADPAGARDLLAPFIARLSAAFGIEAA